MYRGQNGTSQERLSGETGTGKRGRNHGNVNCKNGSGEKKERFLHPPFPVRIPSRYFSLLLHLSRNNPSLTSLSHRILLFLFIFSSPSFLAPVSLRHFLNGGLQHYTTVILRLSSSSLTSRPAVCTYVHTHTHTSTNTRKAINQERGERGLNTANIQGGLTEIIILLMQSMRTDGEVYGVCVFLCAGARAWNSRLCSNVQRQAVQWTKMDLPSVLLSFPLSSHCFMSFFLVMEEGASLWFKYTY